MWTFTSFKLNGSHFRTPYWGWYLIMWEILYILIWRMKSVLVSLSDVTVFPLTGAWNSNSRWKCWRKRSCDSTPALRQRRKLRQRGKFLFNRSGKLWKARFWDAKLTPMPKYVSNWPEGRQELWHAICLSNMWALKKWQAENPTKFGFFFRKGHLTHPFSNQGDR